MLHFQLPPAENTVQGRALLQTQSGPMDLLMIGSTLVGAVLMMTETPDP